MYMFFIAFLFLSEGRMISLTKRFAMFTIHAVVPRDLWKSLIGKMQTETKSKPVRTESLVTSKLVRISFIKLWNSHYLWEQGLIFSKFIFESVPYHQGKFTITIKTQNFIRSLYSKGLRTFFLIRNSYYQ